MVDVRKKVAEITPEITRIREYIHENPELSMHEYNTCALLEDYVKKNVKYDRLKRVGETGLFFELKGKYRQQVDLSGGVVFLSGEDDLSD